VLQKVVFMGESGSKIFMRFSFYFHNNRNSNSQQEEHSIAGTMGRGLKPGGGIKYPAICNYMPKTMDAEAAVHLENLAKPIPPLLTRPCSGN